MSSNTDTIKLKGLYRFCWVLANSPAFVRKIASKSIAAILFLVLKKRLYQRISLAFPDMNQQKVKRIAKTFIFSSCHELASMLDLPIEKFEYEGLELLSDAKSKGAVFASMHMGQTEAPTYAIQKLGFDVCTIIGEGKRNHQMNLLGTSLLDRLGIPYVKKQNGLLFELFNQIRNKRCLFVHSDLREKGMKANFLGQPTTVPITAAFISAYTKAPLYFVYSIRKPDRIKIIIKQLASTEDISALELPKDKAAEALTLEVIKCMEDAIQTYPENWFWHYNRFKMKS